MIIVLDLLLAALLGLFAGLADAVRNRRARRAAVESRLELAAPPGALAVETRPAAAARGLDRLYDLAQRLSAAGVSRRWGMSVSPLALVLGALLGGASTWLVVHGLMKAPAWLSLLSTLAALAATPRVILHFEQRAMEARFLERFPDAVDMVVRALRAGVPLTAAVRAVAAEAEAPVSTVFAELADQTEIGVPLDEALAKAARWIKLPDFRFFAVAVALQYATGGNLALTLQSLSDIVRKRRVTRLKAKAVAAEVRLSTYILGALPFLVVAALLAFSPLYLRPLFTDRRGNWILGIAVGGLVTGLLVMREMMNSVASD